MIMPPFHNILYGQNEVIGKKMRNNCKYKMQPHSLEKKTSTNS